MELFPSLIFTVADFKLWGTYLVQLSVRMVIVLPLE